MAAAHNVHTLLPESVKFVNTADGGTIELKDVVHIFETELQRCVKLEEEDDDEHRRLQQGSLWALSRLCAAWQETSEDVSSSAVPEDSDGRGKNGSTDTTTTPTVVATTTAAAAPENAVEELRRQCELHDQAALQTYQNAIVALEFGLIPTLWSRLSLVRRLVV